MGVNTQIEWTDATWNPIRGCSRVSAGCMHCYAERQAIRQAKPGEAYDGLVENRGNGPRWTGQIRIAQDHMNDPLHWKKPRKIFVNSMGDLFHETIAPLDIASVFRVMRVANWHTYQILTKRPVRMKEFVEAWVGEEGQLMPNVWLGTSVENQATADERIEHLMQTPAKVRFLSCEPLLGRIDLQKALYVGEEGGIDFAYTKRQMLHWVICGGESGPGARPMNLAAARWLRDQCKEAEVPFFFKQLGGVWGKGGDLEFTPKDLWIREYPDTVAA